MQELSQERLSIAISGMAAAESILEQTVEYVKDRKIWRHALFARLFSYST